MKRKYTEVHKDIKDANQMIILAGTEKVKKAWVERSEKLGVCLACPVLTDNVDCPPGCVNL
jgi:hypothetical protein